MHKEALYPSFVEEIFKKLWIDLSSYHSLIQNKRAILSYSGGKDSTFLLHFYFFLYKNHFLKYKPYIYHLSHGIRDNELQEIEIENYIKLNFPFKTFFKKRKILNLSKRLKLSLEETGRAYRKKDLFKILNLESYIVTAHHLNDYIETILINLIRGSGLNTFKVLSIFDNNHFRPLMLLEKYSWNLFFEWEKLVIFEDETNYSNAFLRNRIRKTVLPFLENEGLNAFKVYRNCHSELFFPPEIKTVKLEKVELSTKNFYFYSMQDFKVILDIHLKIMNLYPLNFKALKLLREKLLEEKTFTFSTKQVIFWKSSSQNLFILSKKAKFFKKLRVVNSDIFWNNEKRTYNFDFIANTYKGLKVYHNGLNKKVSEILREAEIPLPIRSFIPILLKKNKISAILLSMWDSKKSDVFVE